MRKDVVILSWLILLFLILSQKCKDNNPYQGYAEIMMLKIVETLQQKGTDHKALLIVSLSIHSFLI